MGVYGACECYTSVCCCRFWWHRLLLLCAQCCVLCSQGPGETTEVSAHQVNCLSPSSPSSHMYWQIINVGVPLSWNMPGLCNLNHLLLVVFHHFLCISNGCITSSQEDALHLALYAVHLGCWVCWTEAHSGCWLTVRGCPTSVLS